MKRVAVIGHFGIGKGLVNGQTIKTENLYNALDGESGVAASFVDTSGWKRHPLRLLVSVYRAVKDNEAVIMLPAKNGVRVFSSLLLLFNSHNSHRRAKLYYDVVGAWLPSLLSQNPHLATRLRKFDGVWAETRTLQIALEKLGFDNVSLVPNFKDITPITSDEMGSIDGYPIRLVIFSRISELKGVSDAINAVCAVNYNSTKFVLDIFGPVEEEYKSAFECLLSKSSGFVKYCGVIDASKSVDVLKKYHALLFPTKSFTEGVPGTIIDAYCAGLPVIASRWESYSDICIDGVSALGYEFGCTELLCELLKDIEEDPSILDGMRPDVIAEGRKYTSQETIKQIIALLEV